MRARHSPCGWALGMPKLYSEVLFVCWVYRNIKSKEKNPVVFKESPSGRIICICHLHHSNGLTSGAIVINPICHDWVNMTDFWLFGIFSFLCFTSLFHFFFFLLKLFSCQVKYSWLGLSLPNCSHTPGWGSWVFTIRIRFCPSPVGTVHSKGELAQVPDGLQATVSCHYFIWSYFGTLCLKNCSGI